MKLLSLSTHCNFHALIQNPRGHTVTDKLYQKHRDTEHHTVSRSNCVCIISYVK